MEPIYHRGNSQTDQSVSQNLSQQESRERDQFLFFSFLSDWLHCSTFLSAEIKFEIFVDVEVDGERREKCWFILGLKQGLNIFV